jgi:branched-chain amino acid transport system substrate-binding protein
LIYTKLCSMKRVLLWLTGFNFLFYSSVALGIDSADKIKIGVSLPLTGQAAIYGEDTKNILLFANNRIAQGRYQLVVEDDKCSGKDAVTAAQKLVQIDRVKYVIGMVCSSSVLSAAPIYEKSGTIVIATAATSPEISLAGKYIFRTSLNGADAARILNQHLRLEHNRVGVLSEETDYSQDLKKSLLKLNADGKLELAAEDYLLDSTDFKTALLRLRRLKVEGLVVNPQAERSFVLIVKQMRELQWDIPLYGFFFPGSQAFLDAVGSKSAEGIVYVDNPDLDQNLSPEGVGLYQEFVSNYGELRSLKFYFISVYSAFYALHQAIQGGEPVQQYLQKHSFNSIGGEFSFDRHGDVIGFSHVLRIIKNGRPALVRH